MSNQEKGNNPQRGSVKFFNQDKGFGFVALESGDSDVFVHVSALPSEGTTLQEGQVVEVDVVQGQKGPQAQSVRLIA